MTEPKITPKVKSKNYWPIETDDLIEEYNACDDGCVEKREKIFEILYPRFVKLAECVFAGGRWDYLGESFEDTKSELVVFMVTKMSYYHKERGKSFSFFTFISRNRLMYNNILGYRKIRTEIPTNFSQAEEENNKMLLSPEPGQYKNELDSLIDFFKKHKSELRTQSKVVDKMNLPDLIIGVLESLNQDDNLFGIYNKHKFYALVKTMTTAQSHHLHRALIKFCDVYELYKKTKD